MQTTSAAKSAKPEKKIPKHATMAELSWFCYQFSLSLKAGLPIVEALQLIAYNNDGFSQTLSQVASDIESGSDLHKAMSLQPLFPDYLLNMIKVGETTGTLDKITESLASYYEREQSFRADVREALSYPLVLILMVSAVIVVLSTKILPVFGDILEASGTELPSIARNLMYAGIFVGKNFIWFLSIAFALVISAYAASLTPQGKRFLSKLKAESKALGSLFQKMYAARTGVVMSYVLESGLSIDDALRMSSAVLGNPYVKERLALCREKIKGATDLAQCFEETKIFPAQFVNMVRVGHKTGNLPLMAGKIAVTYENEVDKALQHIISIVEPALVIVLSAVIGVVLITVMLPLMQIMSSVG